MADTNPKLTRLLSTDEAAGIVHLKPQTLRAQRSRGEGPPYVKIGAAVRYRQSDLEEFIAAAVIQPTPVGGQSAGR